MSGSAAVRPGGPPDPCEAGERGKSPPSDEALLGAALEGDETAFFDLVSRHRHTAVRVAAGIVGANRAEDVVQDALLLAFRGLSSIQDRTKFSRWLAAITRFRALRYGWSESRHVAGHVSLDDSLLQTLSELAFAPREAQQGDELLLEALTRIPPEYAEVVRMHFLHELPHRRIAEFLDVPLTTVKWRCIRGKELLREALRGVPAASTRCDRSPSCRGSRPSGRRPAAGLDPCPNCPDDRVDRIAGSSRSRPATG